MKKLLIAAAVLAIAFPATAQRVDQSAEKTSFDKLYNGLTLNGAIQPQAQKPLSSWEIKAKEIQKKAEVAKAKKEIAAKQAALYAEAEAAVKDIPEHVKQHYDSLLAAGKYKQAVADLYSADVLNKSMKPVKYFVLRQAVVYYGTGILSPSLEVAQSVLIRETSNPNDYLYLFASEIKTKCHNNDSTPFKHLKNISK